MQGTDRRGGGEQRGGRALSLAVMFCVGAESVGRGERESARAHTHTHASERETSAP
jgi:hypothetical protein